MIESRCDSRNATTLRRVGDLRPARTHRSEQSRSTQAPLRVLQSIALLRAWRHCHEMVRSRDPIHSDSGGDFTGSDGTAKPDEAQTDQKVAALLGFSEETRRAVGIDPAIIEDDLGGMSSRCDRHSSCFRKPAVSGRSVREERTNVDWP